MCILWIAAGLLTVYLMYGHSESVPVFKALLVALFGLVSLFVWVIGNIGKSVPNPFFKKPVVATPSRTPKK